MSWRRAPARWSCGSTSPSDPMWHARAMPQWNATFTISLTPGTPLLEGTGRFDLAKEWSGDIVGTSQGVMLSAGDPAAGAAGYVALERFVGTVGAATGTCSLQQCGTMADGDQALHYEVVPGSGTDGLAGLVGRLELVVGEDGTHRVTLRAE